MKWDILCVFAWHILNIYEVKRKIENCALKNNNDNNKQHCNLVHQIETEAIDTKYTICCCDKAELIQNYKLIAFKFE